VVAAPAANLDTLALDSIIHFSIQSASGYYSQLAGVFAGFVFTAMILLLGNPPRGDIKSISAPLLAFLIVFFQLIVASFSFAVVTGDNGEPRSTVLGLIASCVFATASAQMFITIAWFFKLFGVSGTVMRVGSWLCRGVCFIVLVWLVIAMGNAETVMYRRNWQSEPQSIGWIGLLGLFWIGGLLGRARRAPESDQGIVPWMVMSMVATVLQAVYFGLVADTSTEQTPYVFSRPVGYVLMVVQGVQLLFCQLNIPDERRLKSG
jgi:hypothetical protein